MAEDKTKQELVRCEACAGHPDGFWTNDAEFWAAEEAARQIAARPGMMNRYIFHDIKVPILEEMRKLAAVIKRDLLESLIEKYLREARTMERSIALAGNHYTYRAGLNFCLSAARDLESEHLYLLCNYAESEKRCLTIRDKVLSDKQYDLPSENKNA